MIFVLLLNQLNYSEQQQQQQILSFNSGFMLSDSCKSGGK